jgi:2-polyprenyl-3-methyl-5-hydroxy-6-metoxy-1,4-benzoquinol methylase
MTQAYYEEYWLREEESVVGDPLTPRRIELLRAELRPDVRKILDVGSGPGTLVGQLADAGYEATGFDISERAVELASRRYPAPQFLQHAVEDLPWPVEPGSQDVVAAFEVIEHLLRPRALIEGARQALAPGGHLALSTPYHGLLKNTVVALVAFDRHFAAEGDHIRFFSDRALRLLLTSAGFEVDRIRHFGRFPGVWAGVFVWARKASG